MTGLRETMTVHSSRLHFLESVHYQNDDDKLWSLDSVQVSLDGMQNGWSSMRASIQDGLQFSQVNARMVFS